MIKEIRIKNMRNFKDKIVPLTGYDALIGENGTGKSTILICLAIGVTGKHPIGGKTLASIIAMIPDGETEAIVAITQISDGKTNIIERKFIKTNKGNTQKIKINGKKYNVEKASQVINSIFGDEKGRPFALRFNISQFIKMKEKEKQQFLFTFFGDKLSGLTCSEVRESLRIELLKAQDENFLSVLRLIYNVSDYESVPDDKKEEFLGKVEDMFQYKPEEGAEYEEMIKIMSEVPNDVIIQEFIEDIVTRINELKRMRQEELDATRKGLSENRLFLENLRPLVDVNKEINSLEEKKKALIQQKEDYNNYKKRSEEFEESIKKLKIVEPVDEVKLKELKKQQKEKEGITAKITNINGELVDAKAARNTHQKNKEEHESKISLQEKISDHKANIKSFEKTINDTNQEIVDINKSNKEIDKKNEKISSENKKINEKKIDLTGLIVGARSSINTLELEVESFNDGKCPKCLTPVDKMTYNIKDTVKKIEKLKENVGNWGTALNDNKDKGNAELFTLDGSIPIKDNIISIAITNMENETRSLESTEKEEKSKKAYPEAEGLYDKVDSEIKEQEENVLPNLQKSIEGRGIIVKEIKKIEDAKFRNKTNAETLKKMVSPTLVVMPVDIEDLIEDITNRIIPLEEEKTKTIENQGVEKVIARQEENMEKLEKATQFVRAMEKVINAYKHNIIGKMLGSIPDKANKIVRKVFPRMTIIFDGEKCGIYRGQYIPLQELSDGEGVVVTGAIISAMMQEARVKEKVVSFEASELDNKNVILLMKALEGTDLDNVILATYPRAGALKDKTIAKTWNIVNL